MKGISNGFDIGRLPNRVGNLGYFVKLHSYYVGHLLFTPTLKGVDGITDSNLRRTKISLGNCLLAHLLILKD